MENERLKLPERRGYDDAYELAYKIAAEKLVQIKDIERQCHNSGAEYCISDTQKAIAIKYLGRSYVITLPDVVLSLKDSTEEIPLRERALVLHYFISAKGTPLTNKLINFRELPEGTVYYPTFLKRAVNPLINNFGQEPQLLMEAGKKLGGYQAEHGDIALTINAFSRVPITFILWRGDEEFAPQGNVLFDANIPDYLSTEDITVLCETIIWKLVRLLQN